MGSDRSFKTCGDDTEQSVSTSFSKRNRLSQLPTPPNRNACSSSSINQPETDQLILGDSTKEATSDDSSPKTQSQPPSKLSLNLNQSAANAGATSQPSTSDTSNTQLKNMSKAAVLRHLFFSQISSNANATEAPNLASSRETN